MGDQSLTMYDQSKCAVDVAEAASELKNGVNVSNSLDIHHTVHSLLQQHGVVPVEVRGYDFKQDLDHHKLLQTYTHSGFQATNFGLAVEQINQMISCKLSTKPVTSQAFTDNPCGRLTSNCTIFLGYTSNMVSCGVRESIRYLVQHNMIDCIVTTAGGIEEDFIKCLAPFYVGDFTLDGAMLKDRGIHRIGNILVSNAHYNLFEEWLTPILDSMLKEQREEQTKWTPSKVINRLGREIQNTDSIYHWCHKNNIPVFSPALTDGAIGDILFSHHINNPGLVIDIVEDVYRMNCQAKCAVTSGMILLGGGLVKHHICNANFMRGGADYAVYLNTAQEFDGSDSGARPDEAKSWGKIRKEAKPVKIFGEASLLFPLLVAETFVRKFPKNYNDVTNSRNEPQQNDIREFFNASKTEHSTEFPTEGKLISDTKL